VRNRGLEDLFDLGLPRVEGVIDGVHNPVIYRGVSAIRLGW
jgi:hypothetical protein